MWHWDQGHLAYYQFDAVRKIAGFLMNHDFNTATRPELLAAIGLEFRAPKTHSPRRQYSRALKLGLLVSEEDGILVPTSISRALSVPGAVTSDEYLHFLIQAFTEPSPALSKWNPNAYFRHPLLFSVKYLLAKAASGRQAATATAEIVEAFRRTAFTGAEDDIAFLDAVDNSERYAAASSQDSDRQAKESLAAISQISYFHLERGAISLALDAIDAQQIFSELQPIAGNRGATGDEEIRRLADLFRDGSTSDFFEYPNTIVTEVVESGFIEGSKVKRTHVTIERNRELRRAFFGLHPSSVCDFCQNDTGRTYPWTSGVLDLHHLLPLASGTRVDASGTTFADLIPVCPSCHRAVHRFYDNWLRERELADFVDIVQAKDVYHTVKAAYKGAIYV